VIPVAEATGRCEIRPDSYVRRIERNPQGRVTGVTYFDKARKEQFQPARAVVLCANGAETPRLLLMSELANSSGYVGKHLMFNGNTAVTALFEHPLNEYKSVQVTRIVHDFYHSDPKRGYYGGGGMDGRFQNFPILWGLGGLGPDAPQWGGEYKRMLGEYFNKSMVVAGHTTSLPVPGNSVTLDPTLKDSYGLPALRITYKDHPDDIKIMEFMVEKSREIMDAAGARKVWATPVGVSGGTAHLLGTCRMGNDPRTSVIDTDHRTHDVPNLFICDGSSMVTSGRGQPTMTIVALAFRAGERISALAKSGGI